MILEVASALSSSAQHGRSARCDAATSISRTVLRAQSTGCTSAVVMRQSAIFGNPNGGRARDGSYGATKRASGENMPDIFTELGNTARNEQRKNNEASTMRLNKFSRTLISVLGTTKRFGTAPSD